MKNKIILFLLFFYLIIFTSHASTIFIHSDNITDLKAINDQDIIGNLSAATNLHALTVAQTDIQFEYMTTKRSLQLMHESKNICVVNKLKTKERLTKYLFSQPINLFLSHRLYQLSSSPPLFTDGSLEHSISLADLFEQKPFAKVLVSSQVSYGDYLDKKIAQLPKVNKITRHAGEHDTGLLNMFVMGRAEYAILYPHQVYDSKLTFKARSYAISSIAPYVLGHLMCTKNQISAAFIKKVNHHINQKENLDKLLRIHLDNINPNDKKALTYYFQHVFNH